MRAVTLEGPTRKPRHATAFLALALASGSRITLYTIMFKGIFSTRAFLKRTDTLSTIA